ncbi:MAG: cyclic nucleotide-binding domain-containing protein, partial [Spirochaetaceae bacterium]|nr:cyclic nucleotide-binding domain-containing protein [Spirochaetaceae bacterium]
FDVFGELGFLDGLDDSQASLILDTGKNISLSPGELLFRQGDESDSVYCVVEGSLAVFLVSESGEEKEIGIIVSGEPVGELQILTGGSRTATVRAGAEATLASIPGELFVDPKNFQLAQNLEKLIRKRLRHYRLGSVLPKLFGELDQDVIREIEQCGEWVHLSRGDFLCRSGEADQRLFILISGRLIAASADENGIRRVIGEIAAGESVGEMALFTGEKRSADVIAIRDSELIMLSVDAFHSLLARFPGIATGITRIIIERLRDTIHKNGPPRSIKNVCLLPITNSVSIEDFAHELRKAAKQYCTLYYLDASTVERDLRTPGIAEIPEDDPANMRLDTFFNDLENHYDIIIFSADGKDSQWSRRCLRQADKVLLIAEAEDDPTPSPYERSFTGDDSIASPGRSLVLLHSKETLVPRGTAAWLADRKVDFCLHVKHEDEAGYRRLARIVSGRAVGLVLSGGGAKGYAHAGVLKALEEAGIEIDMIGGTSIGSVIGAGYAMGLSPDEIILKNMDLFKRHNPFKEYTLPIMSVLGSGKLDSLFKEAFGEIRIEDLWLNY